MMYVPGSNHLECYPHEPVKKGHHTIQVIGAEEQINKRILKPLKKGGMVMHTGRVLHGSGPNVSDTNRRAYIVN